MIHCNAYHQASDTVFDIYILVMLCIGVIKSIVTDPCYAILILQVLQHMEDVKVREMQIFDYKKKIAEAETKLKQQQNLYEAVRSDRNLYSKNLIESQVHAKPMSFLFIIMKTQVKKCCKYLQFPGFLKRVCCSVVIVRNSGAKDFDGSSDGMQILHVLCVIFVTI